MLDCRLCIIKAMTDLVKIVVTVPEANADELRKAIGDAGGGKYANYSHTSFSVKGTGRFKPLVGANPAIGEVGRPEEVVEERIEVTCFRDQMAQIIKVIKDRHPYEVPAIDVYPLLNINE